MKLLKVGSSPSCDIVIPSGYVSNHHADITVLDSGEILIEDKNSKNGTFIGLNKQKIAPNQEVQIHRGDRVLFGNEPLDWGKVPQPSRFNKAKRIINIGSNQRNDLVIPGGVVSRYHATLIIDKDGHPMLIDNKSTNGTKVNGQRITPERPTRIKRGDNVIVGEEDITDRIAQYLPSGNGGKIALGIAAAIAVIAVLAAAFIWLKPAGTIDDSAVVMIRNVYHYELEPAENPYKIPVKFETKLYAITGTGFFIDEEGRIGTNRHVVAPWLEEYQDYDMFTNMNIQDELKLFWQYEIKNSLPTTVETVEDVDFLRGSEIGRSILEVAYDLPGYWKTNAKNIVESLRHSPAKITGKSDQVSIAYSNRHYTSFEEYQPAVIVGESGDEDKDVAIIQINTSETPEKILAAGIFDVKNFNLTNPPVQSIDLQFKGFPEGVARTWDEHFNSSRNIPTTYHGKVSRNADPYNFEIQAMTAHGSSGSPVYNGNNLYGLVSKGHKTGDDVIIARASWLKELYDQKVMPYRQK